MAIADKLDYLLNTKSQIKQAIVEKGVSISDTDSFRSYTDKIAKLEKVSNCLTENTIDSTHYIFQKIFKVLPKDVCSFLKTIITTSMENMFSGCKNLTGIDLSGFDTSNVTNVTSMFSGCENLTTINGILDFSNVTKTTTFLTGCINLETIYISNLKVSRTSLKDCKKLSHTSLVYLINNLEDNTSSTTAKILILRAENIAKLTEEEIAVATEEKNWTLSQEV